MVAIEFIFLMGACFFYKRKQLKSMLMYQIPLNRYIQSNNDRKGCKSYLFNTYYAKYSHLFYNLQFKCCGVTSYEDWFDIKAWPGKKYVPDSCCQPEFENITGKLSRLLCITTRKYKH